MAKTKLVPTSSIYQIKKLQFLIGKWHTEGEILQDVSDSLKKIRGMDTYEWISEGFFILHRVDVFMGNKRTELIEVIGYDENHKSYFMKSFDNNGKSMTMYAELIKPNVLKFGDDKMQALLTANKKGNSMIAKWHLSDNSKIWKPWMNMTFRK
jgi:hypothetical protein